MAEALSRFGGDIAYVDAVTLIAHLDQDHPIHEACDAFMARANDPAQPVSLVTATLTLDEVVIVLLQELIARPPYAVGRDRVRYLGRHPETVKELAAVTSPIVRALSDRLQLEPVVPDDIHHMSQAMMQHGLLPRDAIHYSVARRLGITAFASDDDAFDGLPGIVLFKP